VESNSIKGEGDLCVLLNQNFFLDPLSSKDDKAFLTSLESIYHIENLNMKGPAGLSIRGLLYRNYPGEWETGRRLDQGGGYEVIKTFSTKPCRKTLDDVFYRDSDVRDRNLSLLDRLKKQIPRFD
jgi:hypothetical protein